MNLQEIFTKIKATVASINLSAFVKKPAFIVVLLVLCLSCCTCGMCRCNSCACNNPTKESYEEVGEYFWPDSELCSLIPQPQSNIGKITWNSPDTFWIDVHHITPEQFNAYVSVCKERGFVVDYMGYDGYYAAKNAAGYELMLTYNSDDQVMNISLNTPYDETQPTDTTASSEATTISTETTTTTTTTTAATTTTTAAPSGGIRPDFKAAMDSYEKFFKEYCDFMKKYTANPTDLRLIAQYADMMKQYADTMEKMEAWEDGDLNDAELKYYLEVSARIEKMLFDAAL